MYNTERIVTSLMGLWGWRQNHDMSDFSISDYLIDSEIGEYYQDVHPVVTLNNIRNIAPTFSDITHPAWLVSVDYKKSEIVTSPNGDFKAKADNVGLDPEQNPIHWEAYNGLSDWLRTKTKGSIAKVIRSLCDSNIGPTTFNNLLSTHVAYDSVGFINDTITNEDNLVGFNLIPARSNGVVTNIKRIGLHFTGVGDVTVHLLHSSQKQPIKSQTFTRTKSDSQQWFDVEDWDLAYVDDSHDAGGFWSVVYDQTGMTEQAINATGGININPSNKFVTIGSFKTSDFTTGGIDSFDLRETSPTMSTNYGMNLQLSTSCDFTQIFIDQRNVFRSLIGLQVNIDMIKTFIFNPENKVVRGTEVVSNMELQYELEGDSQGYKKSGLVHQYNNALESAIIDLSKVSRLCTKCKKKGIKFGTV